MRIPSPVILKPCPFCGGLPKLEEIRSNDAPCYQVQCTVCDAKGKIGWQYSQTEAIAYAARYWNRRVP